MGVCPKRQTFGTVLRLLSEDLPKSLLDGLLFGLGQDGFPGWFKGLLGWQSRPLSLSGEHGNSVPAYPEEVVAERVVSVFYRKKARKPREAYIINKE